MDYKELLTRKLELEQELNTLEVQINNCRTLELENKYIGKWFVENNGSGIYYTKITSLNCYNIPKGFGFGIFDDAIELLTNVEIDMDVARESSEEEASKAAHDFISRIFKPE